MAVAIVFAPYDSTTVIICEIVEAWGHLPVLGLRHTFFKTPKDDIRLFHIDFPQKSHIRETLYDCVLSGLRDLVVVRSHKKSERRIEDEMFPAGLICTDAGM